MNDIDYKNKSCTYMLLISEYIFYEQIIVSQIYLRVNVDVLLIIATNYSRASWGKLCTFVYKLLARFQFLPS